MSHEQSPSPCMLALQGRDPQLFADPSREHRGYPEDDLLIQLLGEERGKPWRQWACEHGLDVSAEREALIHILSQMASSQHRSIAPAWILRGARLAIARFGCDNALIAEARTLIFGTLVPNLLRRMSVEELSRQIVLRPVDGGDDVKSTHTSLPSNGPAAPSCVNSWKDAFDLCQTSSGIEGEELGNRWAEVAEERMVIEGAKNITETWGIIFSLLDRFFFAFQVYRAGERRKGLVGRIQRVIQALVLKEAELYVRGELKQWRTVKAYRESGKRLLCAGYLHDTLTKVCQCVEQFIIHDVLDRGELGIATGLLVHYSFFFIRTARWLSPGESEKVLKELVEASLDKPCVSGNHGARTALARAFGFPIQAEAAARKAREAKQEIGCNFIPPA